MTLIPAKHTFTIWQGSTFYEVLTLYLTSDRTQPRDFYSRDTESPTLLFSAEMVIRDKPKGDPLLINGDDAILSTGNERIVFPSEEENIGKIYLIISDDDTATIDWKTGVYDLTITKLATETDPHFTDTLLYGGIKVLGV